MPARVIGGDEERQVEWLGVVTHTCDPDTEAEPSSVLEVSLPCTVSLSSIWPT